MPDHYTCLCWCPGFPVDEICSGIEWHIGPMQVRSRLPEGVDGWAYSLRGMMGMVVIGGFLITAVYWFLQRTVVPRVKAGQPKKKKQKMKLGMGDSFKVLASKQYIRDLAMLVSFRPLQPHMLAHVQEQQLSYGMLQYGIVSRNRHSSALQQHECRESAKLHDLPL